jgi:delta-aminolevulinic acid dehydratase/porphobilinogen synthase|tara:strand:+ start:363 stop:617 length:255 start_codon:yes stop_codon:yes gene_type:complete
MLYKNILNINERKNKMVRNNLDLAMLITDAILNEFEKNGKCNIPLDESKDSKPYAWDLQDVIQTELEKIAEGDNINDNTKSIGE